MSNEEKNKPQDPKPESIEPEELKEEDLDVSGGASPRALYGTTVSADCQ
jgi:hypothetical protein